MSNSEFIIQEIDDTVTVLVLPSEALARLSNGNSIVTPGAQFFINPWDSLRFVAEPLATALRDEVSRRVVASRGHGGSVFTVVDPARLGEQELRESWYLGESRGSSDQRARAILLISSDDPGHAQDIAMEWRSEYRRRKALYSVTEIGNTETPSENSKRVFIVGQLALEHAASGEIVEVSSGRCFLGVYRAGALRATLLARYVYNKSILDAIDESSEGIHLNFGVSHDHKTRTLLMISERAANKMFRGKLATLDQPGCPSGDKLCCAGLDWAVSTDGLPDTGNA